MRQCWRRETGAAAGVDYVSPSDALNGSGLHLYRLFGDVDGNGVVDSQDLSQFRNCYNHNYLSALYQWYLDCQNDGTVDSQDLAEFRTRYNTNVFA